jgi:hypothetical protein
MPYSQKITFKILQANELTIYVLTPKLSYSKSWRMQSQFWANSLLRWGYSNFQQEASSKSELYLPDLMHLYPPDAPNSLEHKCLRLITLIPAYEETSNTQIDTIRIICINDYRICVHVGNGSKWLSFPQIRSWITKSLTDCCFPEFCCDESWLTNSSNPATHSKLPEAPTWRSE